MYARRLEVPGRCDMLTMPVGAVCRRLWRRIKGEETRKTMAWVAGGGSGKHRSSHMDTGGGLLDIPTYVRMGRRLSA